MSRVPTVDTSVIPTDPAWHNDPEAAKRQPRRDRVEIWIWLGDHFDGPHARARLRGTARNWGHTRPPDRIVIVDVERRTKGPVPVVVVGAPAVHAAGDAPKTDDEPTA